MGKHTRPLTFGGVPVVTDCRVPIDMILPADLKIGGPHTCGQVPCDGALSDGTVTSRETDAGIFLYAVPRA